MKPDLANPRAVSDAAAKKETGKTLEQWFEVLDRAGGPGQGRAALGKLLLGEHKLDPSGPRSVARRQARGGARGGR